MPPSISQQPYLTEIAARLEHGDCGSSQFNLRSSRTDMMIMFLIFADAAAIYFCLFQKGMRDEPTIPKQGNACTSMTLEEMTG